MIRYYMELWDELSEKEKLAVVAVIAPVAAACDIALAVKLLNAMKAYGILDYVLSLTNDTMIRVWQYIWQLLTG